MSFPIDGYDLDGARDGDLDFILSCVREDVLVSVTKEERELSSTWIDDTLMLPRFAFAKRPMADEFFVLRKDGRDIGMIWLGKSRDQFTMDDVGFVMGLYVVEDERGRGLGRGLMEFAEGWTRDRGMVTLALNVGDLNVNAMGFYEHLGYVTQTRVMRKNLK